jgi:hypothetical protein
MRGGRHRGTGRTRRARLTRTRVGRVILVVVTLVVMAAIVAVAAVLTYWRAGPPPPSTEPPAQTPGTPAPGSAPSQAGPGVPAGLEAEFTQLGTTLHAKMGIAFSAVGNGQNPTRWGDWQEGPAWSTIKVPLVIAGYRQQMPPQITDTMRAAIVESDNAAAESVWATLGNPPAAAQRVQQVLQETGDPTTVESRKVRPEFTAFGQTIWPLVDQVRFISSAVCNSENDPIFNLMGQVEPDQSWGIGAIAGSQFKGGWGPSPSGKYLVRQIGVLTTPTGKVAVAIATEPASGQFADGTQELGEVAKWLRGHLEALPAGHC